ncbi:putative ribonuclease H protein At1g65750 family [Senna tora]|uniref:Putative ribonuclease H protein At1g65750 family n=1 Tax=Senna tora TaxID=362788 RepID=A0A834TQD9_9FABA|nr:putative ribonuclease H protein At1g65750 family [Senna tora]
MADWELNVIQAKVTKEEIINAVFFSMGSFKAPGPDGYQETSLIPNGVCNDIEKLNRGFLWNSSGRERKPHLVAWKEVCEPVEKGGLDIRPLQSMNCAMLMKLGWWLIEDKDSLWARVLRSKYNCGSDLIPLVKKMSSGSCVWNEICSLWSKVEEGIRWNVGNSGSVRRSVAVPAPITELGVDRVMWNLNSNGRFSVSSAYYMDKEKPLEDESKFWKMVWRWPGPQKFKSFLWQFCKDKLYTNLCSFGRRVSGDLLCLRYNVPFESSMHDIRHCEEVRSL